MENIKHNLKDFYNQEAEKYYNSRQKHRNDWNIILNEIKKSWKKEISILEFGCWWGRFIKFLNENLKWIKIKYIWIDLSEKLLDFAKKDNPKCKFVCEDISKFITNEKQESYDYIVGIACFQHIYSPKERKFLIKHFYKILNYWWKIIMTNWSLSERFIKKYTKPLLESIWKFIYSIWNHKWRDIMIPWKNWKNLHKRYYHIFSKKELEQLIKGWWFKINKLTYLDKNGHETTKRKDSNNTIVIWEKQVFW